MWRARTLCKNCKAKVEHCRQGVNKGDDKFGETQSASLNVTESVFLCPDGNKKWCLDSGCTSHMSADRNNFKQLSEMNQVLNLANNNSTNIEGIGSVKFVVNENGCEKDITLSDVLYVSDLRTNLLSVSKITDKGYEVHFRKNDAAVIDKNKNVLFTAERNGNLYFIKI